MGDIEKLKALLETDESGEEIAEILNRLLVDEGKRNVLVMKLMEMEKNFATFEKEVSFTKAEEIVRNVVLSANKPLTSQEIINRIGDEHRSLKYHSHVSATLQSLIRKGVLGKYRFRTGVYFTEAKNAVIETMKKRGELPSDCSPNDIAKETELPVHVVLNVIEELMT